MTQAATGPVVQRRVGQTPTAVLLTLLPLVLVVIAAVVAPFLPEAGILVLAALVVVVVVWVSRPGYGQLLWFGAARLVLDDEGVLFGTDKTRRRTPTASYAPQLAYRAPWSAVSEVAMIDGTAAARQMARDALVRPRLPQVSCYYGYFPARWRRVHLAFSVDLAQVRLPETTTRGNTVARSHPMQRSLRWVLPVRDAEAVRAALAARGVAVGETRDAVLPHPDVDELEATARRLKGLAEDR